MVLINRIGMQAFKASCKAMGVNPAKGLHGINPSTVIDGEKVLLPRFCSEEMQTAVKMNKQVLHGLRTPNSRTYSKATAEDLRRLTSDTLEDSYSRVEWTNPKDGKVYNILKQGETKDGKVAVRILDKDGAFVKEAELTPKIIGINDDFTGFNEYVCYGMPHGNMCLTYAKRNNPFAKYVTFDTNTSQIANGHELDKINDYISNGGKLDYLSCSYGHDITLNKKFIMEDTSLARFAFDRPYDAVIEKTNARVLMAGSNYNKDVHVASVKELSNQYLVMNKNVEGVGSINPKTRRISDFSLSRNSELTQHYEVGEYSPQITTNGLNITGLSGTDVGCNTPLLEMLQKNPLLGKPVEKVANLKKMIEARIDELRQQHYKILMQDKTTPFAEKMKKMQKIDDAKFVNEQRRARLLDNMLGLKESGGVYTANLEPISGTSFATPVRTAKLALNDMLEGVL